VILELSKNKSLLYVLTKVELDEETKALLETDATKLELRKSLINNLNTSNMITYRKLIKKADEEIDTDEALEEQKRKEEEEALEDLSDEEARDIQTDEDDEDEKDLVDIAEENIQETNRQIDARMIASDAKERRRKEITKVVRIADDYVAKIKRLNDIKDEETTSLPADFRTMPKSKISRIIEFLNTMKDKKRYFLQSPFNEFIKNGDFVITTTKRDKTGTKTGRKGTITVDEVERIDIQLLNDTYADLAQEDFILFLGKLYQMRFDENAPALRDKRKLTEQYKGILESIRTKDTSGSKVRHRKIVEKYKQSIANTQKSDEYKGTIQSFREYIEELKDLSENDVKFLLEEKEKILRQALGSLQNNFIRYVQGKKRTPISRKDLQDFENELIDPLERRMTDPRERRKTKLTEKETKEKLKQIKESLSAVSNALEPDADLIKEIKDEMLDEINKEIETLEEMEQELSFMDKAIDPSEVITEYLNHPNKETRMAILDEQEELANQTAEYYRQRYLVFQDLKSLVDKSKKDFEGFIEGNVELSAVRTTFIDDAGITEDETQKFLTRALTIQQYPEQLQEKINILEQRKREMKS
jgi:hypothetical protein